MQNKEPKCALCGSRSGGVFSRLSNSDLDKLDHEKIVRDYKRGQIVFYEGDTPSALYCIHSGCVKLYKIGKRNEETVIRLLDPADIAGYRALLADEPFAATAEAIVPSKICVISKQTFLDLAHCQNELANQLMAKLALELKESEEQWLIRSQETVRKRTARFLIQLHERRGKKTEEDSKFRISLPRNEMAQAIGTTPETLSRTLHAFAERGIIQLSRTEIVITNLMKLKMIVPE